LETWGRGEGGMVMSMFGGGGGEGGGGMMLRMFGVERVLFQRRGIALATRPWLRSRRLMQRRGQRQATATSARGGQEAGGGPRGWRMQKERAGVEQQDFPR
jgi:hypothetical protein